MNKENINVLKKVFYVLGIIISILLLLVLIMNFIIVIKASINPDKIPSFLGKQLFIVETNSMKPLFDGGDLIVNKKVDPKTLKVGDVVAYSEEKVVVTHRIEEIQEEDGKLSFITKGDANNAADINPVSEDNVESIYWFRIKNLGRVAMFMQTPFGMFLFVGLPVIGFIVYDILRQKNKTGLNNIEKDKEIQRLKDELEKKGKEK